MLEAPTIDGGSAPTPTLPHKKGGEGGAAPPQSPSPSMGEGWGGGDGAMTRVAPPAKLGRQALIDLARQVAVRLGKKQITGTEFRRETGLTDRRILSHFDGWRDFLATAGLEPHYQNVRLTDDALFAAMRDAFLAAGRITSKAQFERHCKYSLGAYANRWRRWRSILAVFHDWVVAHDPAFPYLDALRAAACPAPTRLRAGRAAGTTAEAAPPAAQWTPVGDRQYGEVLNFRGLQHAPLNEQGVVLLFGMMAAELGFIVEAVTTGYPDCEAKRRVAVNPERWQRVRIEFEWQSRSFRTHGHDPEGCDLVVCWEHNWPECPVEVLELKREVRRVAG